MRRRGISRYRARRPAFRLFLADAALGPCIRRLVPCRGWRNGILARWYTLFAREEGERSPHRAQSRHMARSAPRAVRVALRSCFRQSVEGAQSFEQGRSEEHTSELQSLMRTSYAVFCLKKKTKTYTKSIHV